MPSTFGVAFGVHMESPSFSLARVASLWEFQYSNNAIGVEPPSVQLFYTLLIYGGLSVGILVGNPMQQQCNWCLAAQCPIVLYIVDLQWSQHGNITQKQLQKTIFGDDQSVYLQDAIQAVLTAMQFKRGSTTFDLSSATNPLVLEDAVVAIMS